ncbi:hypothetical protein DSO57_1019292 [Entomophthora muscae]|uniref:Uncharacterized protein n=1 Tax=Entomophthora muscae TaxID=34485 RepID=A0ACC2S640_9FUNG|nr:hypothetical protein DSO57_1019292 [Entomophthora muscae]
MAIRTRNNVSGKKATEENNGDTSQSYTEIKEADITKKVIGSGSDQFSFIELLGYTLVLTPVTTLLGANGYLFGPKLLEPMLGNYFPAYYFHSLIFGSCLVGALMGLLLHSKFLGLIGKGLGLISISQAASPIYIDWVTSFSLHLGPYITTHLAYIAPVYLPVLLCSWLNVSLLFINMSFFKQADTPLHSIVLLTAQLALLIGGFSVFIGGFIVLSPYSCFGLLYTACGGAVGLCLMNFTLLRRLRSKVFHKMIVPCVILLTAGYTMYYFPRCGPFIPDNSLQPAFKVLARDESTTGWITVTEEAKRRVRVMRSGHSIIGGTFMDYDESIFGSFYYMEAVQYIKRQSSKQSSALQLGLGIGISARSLIESGVHVDVVEIDPLVYSYAQSFFKLPQPSKVFLQDGYHFLNSIANESSYDYILHDVFTGGTVPSQLFSVEALMLCKRALKQDGVLALNYVGGVLHPYNSSFNAIAATIQSVFSHVRVFTEEFDSQEDLGKLINLVFFAADYPIEFSIPTKFHDPESIRALSLKDFTRYEVRLEDYLPEAMPPPITQANNYLHTLQHSSAYTHWYKMKELFPLNFWQKY